MSCNWAMHDIVSFGLFDRRRTNQLTMLQMHLMSILVFNRNSEETRLRVDLPKTGKRNIFHPNMLDCERGMPAAEYAV